LERFKSAAHDEKKRLEFRSRLGLKPEDKVLLYLGRVSNEKHIDELLDYLFRLFPEITGLKLVITGEGAAYNRLVKRVKSANQVENVIFTGPVPLSEVPHYYAMADIFTSASQSETQGLTYIEAQASGLPLLVRKDPALDKVITDGSNGYYFTDEESFAANLRQLLSRLRQNREEIFQLSLATAARFGVCKFAGKILIDCVKSMYKRDIILLGNRSAQDSQSKLRLSMDNVKFLLSDLPITKRTQIKCQALRTDKRQGGYPNDIVVIN
jgi:1,2-diacylglycerol 3-alpha-glucosyltransferase